ncbi:MAG TPA: DUF3891 family protein [Bryobacteraceae bacterium]
MIFRRLSHEGGGATGIRPAFPIFLELQNLPQAPHAVILQPDHSRLAGEIAKRLHASVFGDLPAEVLDAIREHDFGWEMSDRNQLANMRSEPLRPFPQLSPEETHPSWRESVRRAQESSPLKGVIISRHFCALASQFPPHFPFAEAENPRREQIERELKIPREDLDRWTAAIGFCDIVSLYLCCGAREPAEFSLAHPSLPSARQARKVVLEWVQGQPRFTEKIMVPGAAVYASAWEVPALHTTELEWRFLG